MRRIGNLRRVGVAVLMGLWITFWFAFVHPRLATIHPRLVERTVLMPGSRLSSPSTFLAALSFVCLLVVIGWVTGTRSFSADWRLLESVVSGRREDGER